jgi:hypothetical protein
VCGLISWGVTGSVEDFEIYICMCIYIMYICIFLTLASPYSVFTICILHTQIRTANALRSAVYTQAMEAAAAANNTVTSHVTAAAAASMNITAPSQAKEVSEFEEEGSYSPTLHASSEDDEWTMKPKKVSKKIEATIQMAEDSIEKLIEVNPPSHIPPTRTHKLSCTLPMIPSHRNILFIKNQKLKQKMFRCCC